MEKKSLSWFYHRIVQKYTFDIKLRLGDTCVIPSENMWKQILDFDRL